MKTPTETPAELRPSYRRLIARTNELTDLLVGLVDAALDRSSAALDSDNQAALALREALGRMRARGAGLSRAW